MDRSRDKVLRVIKEAVLILVLSLNACVTAPTGFARLSGVAEHLDIPVYQGTPSAIYTRVDHGKVSGKASPSSTLAEQRYRALYNLAQAAKAAGANAVIEVEERATDDGLIYSGEAVSFDLYPPDSVTSRR